MPSDLFVSLIVPNICGDSMYNGTGGADNLISANIDFQAGINCFVLTVGYNGTILWVGCCATLTGNYIINCNVTPCAAYAGVCAVNVSTT
jgi:hypothetical protein